MKTAWIPLAALTTGLLPAQTSLEQQFREQLRAQPQPAWVGYVVPAVSGHGDNCDYSNEIHRATSGPRVVHLEPPDQLQVLFRIEQGRVGKIRAISGDCQLEADGVPLRWLRDVRPAESIALLTGMVTEPDRVADGAIAAIGELAAPRLPRQEHCSAGAAA